MSSRTTVVARVELEGFHYWPDAFAEVEYLRFPHRHLFIVRAARIVSDNDRECEFITLGRDIAAYLKRKYGSPMQLQRRSCEMVAHEVLKEFKLHRVEVWEDDENGAVVEECCGAQD